MNARILAIVLLAGVNLGLCMPAHALYVRCVGNSQQLQQALSDSADALYDDDFIIKVVRSATPYAIATGTPSYPYGALSILGGYDNTCSSRIINPANTILDFGKTNAEIDMYEAPSGSLLQIDGVTLRNGAALYISGGSHRDITPDASSNVRVTNARITNFSTTDNDGDPSDFFIDDAPVSIGGTSSSIFLRNVQIDHVTQKGNSACSVEISFEGNTTGTLSYLTVDLVNGKAFCFEAAMIDDESGDFQFDVYNSIFWSSDNSGAPLHGRTKEGPIHINLVDDIFTTYTGDGVLNVSGKVTPVPGGPLWVDPLTANYHLAASVPGTPNPAINSGAASVPLGNPSFDIESNLRKFGSLPDRGAYESPYSDANTFTVGNASDCSSAGCGSLRAAIQDANNSTATAVKIQFAIPVACPAVITVGTPLPDIVKPTTIDGYTQSGSAPNDDPYAFDAKLCVVVQPGASAYYALRVPADKGDGSLTVTGVGFGGFHAAVELLGGNHHQVVGNQFGGQMNNGSYQLYGSDVAAVYVNAPNGQVTIGGDELDYPRRNAFLNVTSFGGPPASAIQLGPQVNANANDCQVLGNTIGVLDDGTWYERTIDYGIYVQGDGCLLRGNRIVGVKYDAIFLDGAFGGGSYNTLQKNILGTVPYGIDFTTSNLGAGVRISGSHNVVGQGPIFGNGVAANANRIQNMNSGGIAIVGNGFGNTIRGNEIFANGADGGAMSIDLAADGPTGNDFADADGGPNGLQNFPSVHSIAWASAPKLGAVNLGAAIFGTLRTYPGSYYQIDAYVSDSCGNGQRGIAQKWLGSNDLVGLPALTYNEPFNVQVIVPDYYPGARYVTVTATNNNNGQGSTSETSTCFPIDGIFRDNVEGGLGFD